MNDNSVFCFKNLELKSNSIVGFIVIQSLFLCERMSGAKLASKLHEDEMFKFFILLSHALLVIFAFFSVRTIGKRQIKLLGEFKDEIFSSQTTLVKSVLVWFFGSMPIFVLVRFFVLV